LFGTVSVAPSLHPEFFLMCAAWCPRAEVYFATLCPLRGNTAHRPVGRRNL
jgi:hypothetical protein